MNQDLVNAITRCVYEEAVAATPAARNYWHRKSEELEYLAYCATSQKPGRA